MFELRLARVNSNSPPLRLCIARCMRPEGVLLYRENLRWAEYHLFCRWTIEFSTLKRRVIFPQKVYRLKIALVDRLDPAFR